MHSFVFTFLLFHFLKANPTFERIFGELDDSLAVYAVYCDGDPDRFDELQISNSANGIWPTRGLRCEDAHPGSRTGSTSIWSDGLFYVFGGYGYNAQIYKDSLDDMWSYEPESGQWAWHCGDVWQLPPWKADHKHNVANYPSSNPTLDVDWTGEGDIQTFQTANPGEYHIQHEPGGLERACMWESSTDGFLYLFGGLGYFRPRRARIASQQVWCWQKANNQWTYYSGSGYPLEAWSGNHEGIQWSMPANSPKKVTILPAQPLEEPGARSMITAFHPTTDYDLVFIFGGYFDDMRSWNDMWMYNMTLDQEKTGSKTTLPVPTPSWIPLLPLGLGWEDDGNVTTPYPCERENITTIGSFNKYNIPASRYGYFGWQYKLSSETHDRFYVFGGYDNCNGQFLSDLWRYDYKLNQWMMVNNNGGNYKQKKASYYHRGVYHEDSWPGGRSTGAVQIFERSGGDEFYAVLYNGYGLAKNGPGFLADVWFYDHQQDLFSYVDTNNEVNYFGVWEEDPGVENNETLHISGRYAFNSFMNITKNIDHDISLYIFGGMTYVEYDDNYILDSVLDLWKMSFTDVCYQPSGSGTTETGWLPVWNPSVCSSHGTCLTDNVCECSWEYEGDRCSTKKRKCDGKVYDDEGVCQAKGFCKKEDECYCTEENTYGRFCEETYYTRGNVFEKEKTFKRSWEDGGNKTVTFKYSRIDLDVVIPLEYINVNAENKETYHSSSGTNFTMDFLGTYYFNCSDQFENIEDFGTNAVCFYESESTVAVSTNIADQIYIYLGEDHSFSYDENKLTMMAKSGVQDNETFAIYVTEGFDRIEAKDYWADFLKTGSPAFGAILLLCICACCCCCCLFCCTAYGFYVGRKRWLKLRQLKHVDIIRKEKLLDIGGFHTLEVNDELFNIGEEELTIVGTISTSGSTAIVYLAKYKKKKVAFKCYKTRNIETQDNLDDFEKEVSILKNMNHPNLLIYYGCMLKVPQIGIVMEYCPNGDLRNYLTDDLKYTKMDFPNRLRVIKEICAAMKHLNDFDIIHRDLKGDNILLTENLTCKLIDFGLSRVVEGATSVYLTKQAGTSQYMAPEVTLSSRYGPKCDVFSMGILIYEIVTNDFFPYGKMPAFNVELKVALNPDFRPPIREKLLSKLPILGWLVKLMEDSWNVDVDVRPDFGEIIEIVSEFEEETGPEFMKHVDVLENEKRMMEVVEFMQENKIGQTVNIELNEEQIKTKANEIGENMEEVLDNLDFDF